MRIVKRNGNIGVDVKALALDDSAYGFGRRRQDRRSSNTRFRSGLAATWRRRRELRRARREADAELLLSAFTTPRTAWRAAELTSEKNRLGLARAIERLLRSADARYLPGATPLNRAAVREHAETLRVLAARLSHLESPIGARGVLMLARLLEDGYGPLYVSYRAIELRDALARAAAACDVAR